MTSKTETIEGTVAEYVTAVIGGQLFGLPISRVQDVFMPERLTRVPLAAPEIAGVLNLRGRIVTAIDMRRRLGLPPREDGRPPMAVGIELRCWSARIVSANSNPFISGISISVSTTSNSWPERSALKPSCALGATRTR